MKFTKYPPKSKWNLLSKRPVLNWNELNPLVREIFTNIKKEGDSGLIKYTERFDKVKIDEFIVSKEEIKKAKERISDELKVAIQMAASNIRKFHASQRETVKIVETMPGVKCWRESRPIEKVGFYIPGGTAPLFSTVLMLGIPAQIARCNQIVLCSPPDKNGEIDPTILYAADLVGVTEIIKIGGVQAIAALTFGTKSVPKVDKIFGPGNQYVMAAKQHALHHGVSIDIPAGPSEVLIIADEKANPRFVASDLLSQAEHGSDSQVILLSNSENVIEKVKIEIDYQIKILPRKEIVAKALNSSKLILMETIEECIEFSNFYAPEHLILNIENAVNYTHKIENAGSVFLGKYSCESAGDYASGTNHTLPTNGYSKSYSGVSLDSFVKKITFQELNKEGVKSLGNYVELMAEAEGLHAHKNAMSIRLKSLK